MSRRVLDFRYTMSSAGWFDLIIKKRRRDMKNAMKRFWVVCCLSLLASLVYAAVCPGNKNGTLPALVKAYPGNIGILGHHVMRCPDDCVFTSTSNPRANGTYHYELIHPGNRYCNPVRIGPAPAGPGGGHTTTGGTTTDPTTDVG